MGLRPSPPGQWQSLEGPTSLQHGPQVWSVRLHTYDLRRVKSWSIPRRHAPGSPAERRSARRAVARSLATVPLSFSL